MRTLATCWMALALLAAPAAEAKKCKGTKVFCGGKCRYPADCPKKRKTPKPPQQNHRPDKYRCDFKNPAGLCGFRASTAGPCSVGWAAGHLQVRNVQQSGACFTTYQPVVSHGPRIQIRARMKFPVAHTGGLMLGDFWDTPGGERSRYYYTFQLYPDGTFRIWQKRFGKWEQLIEDKPPSLKRSGENLLVWTLVDGSMVAAINGKTVASILVGQPPKRHVGVYANDPGTVVEVDWLEVRKARKR